MPAERQIQQLAQAGKSGDARRKLIRVAGLLEQVIRFNYLGCPLLPAQLFRMSPFACPFCLPLAQLRGKWS
jgi:hypothetical protein